MSRYASQTEVSTDRSLAEIQATVRRYGATGFMTGWEHGEGQHRAMVQFKAADRFVRFILPLPDPHAKEFTLTPAGKRQRDEAGRVAAWEQACRQRWRALALAIKAKLEAVEAGIATFEEEFLAHIVLPDGSTVGGHVLPRVQRAYVDGAMPKLLPEWSGDAVVEAEVVE